MLFALIASFLWIVNSLYSIGYMRGNKEPRQTQFYVAFAVALASTMGIALSANLFTLFIFYEALTLSTYPLVAHHGDARARGGARTYLLILLSTSIVFFIPALVWTLGLTGTLNFTPDGILADVASPLTTALLLALFAFGIGKAALMPFHRWLPSAMVAPTPVSARCYTPSPWSRPGCSRCSRSSSIYSGPSICWPPGHRSGWSIWPPSRCWPPRWWR